MKSDSFVAVKMVKNNNCSLKNLKLVLFYKQTMVFCNKTFFVYSYFYKKNVDLFVIKACNANTC